MEQSEKELKMYNGRVYGFEVSRYGVENGYLDYLTLSKIVGPTIMNNYILEETGFENWDLISGTEEDENGYHEVYQYYIISESGYLMLEALTDEIVYYNERLNMYVWGVTHFGTSWDYVLTDIKVSEL